jgi:hypothetical protein
MSRLLPLFTLCIALAASASGALACEKHLDGHSGASESAAETSRS